MVDRSSMTVLNIKTNTTETIRFIPCEPKGNNLGGITLEERNKIQTMSEKINTLETDIESGIDDIIGTSN